MVAIGRTKFNTRHFLDENHTTTKFYIGLHENNVLKILFLDTTEELNIWNF